jgi:hypothetical protein
MIVILLMVVMIVILLMVVIMETALFSLPLINFPVTDYIKYYAYLYCLLYYLSLQQL